MKEHYTNLHWGDWFKDTACLRPATRGIWLDMIGEMARRGTDRIHSQFDRLPFVLRDTPAGIMQAAIELAENDTADVLVDGVPLLAWRSKLSADGISELDWITNRMAKAYLTVICRRRAKELEIRKIRSEAGKKGMAQRWQTDNKPDNKPPNKPVTPSGNGNGNGITEGVQGETPKPPEPEYKPWRESADRILAKMSTLAGHTTPVPSTVQEREVIYGALNEGYTEVQLLAVVKIADKECRENAGQRRFFTPSCLFSLKTLPGRVRSAKPVPSATHQPPQPTSAPLPPEVIREKVARSFAEAGQPTRRAII